MTKNRFNWDFDNSEMEAKFKEPLTKANCGAKLQLIIDHLGISHRELARIIGVSESTIRRLAAGDKGKGSTLPSDDFMNRLQALCAIGAAKYAKLSEADKEKISEFVGTTGGVVAGVGGSIAAIGAAGAVSGFSAAGITSGLAAVGGGAMLTGIGVVAAIPVATGLLGYGLVKGIKAICKANNLSCTEVDERWEIKRKDTQED